MPPARARSQTLQSSSCTFIDCQAHALLSRMQVVHRQTISAHLDKQKDCKQKPTKDTLQVGQEAITAARAAAAAEWKRAQGDGDDDANVKTRAAAAYKRVIDEVTSRSESSRSRMASPSVLLLSPTRELAEQTATSVARVTTELNGSMELRSECIVGGVDYHAQRAALFSGLPEILISTPGHIE